MLTLCIVCTTTDVTQLKKYDGYVGVDQGALSLAQQHITMEMAIGDFDSVLKEDLSEIKQFSKIIESLNPIKNESDLEAALDIWHNKASIIHVYGALNGRLDHQYVNIQLMKKYNNVHLINENNHCMVSNESMEISADGFTYFSLFALEDSVVSIYNAKYELNKQKLTSDDLFTLSNEFTSKNVIIEIYQGKVIVIKSKDK